MVKAIFEIPERENKILNGVKARKGFKNREQAFVFVLQEYDQSLEPELRPEFIKEMRRIEKEKHHSFKDINDLRKQIEK